MANNAFAFLTLTSSLAITLFSMQLLFSRRRENTAYYPLLAFYSAIALLICQPIAGAFSVTIQSIFLIFLCRFKNNS